jgi:hypothetical protein
LVLLLLCVVAIREDAQPLRDVQEDIHIATQVNLAMWPGGFGFLSWWSCPFLMGQARVAGRAFVLIVALFAGRALFCWFVRFLLVHPFFADLHF